MFLRSFTSIGPLLKGKKWMIPPPPFLNPQITGGHGFRVAPSSSRCSFRNMFRCQYVHVWPVQIFLERRRRRKRPRHSSNGGSRHIDRPECAGAISAVFGPKFLVLCMDAHFSSQWINMSRLGHWKFFFIVKTPFLVYFGHFLGARRLIFTQPTF